MNPQSPHSLALLKRPIPSTGELIPAIGLGTYNAFDISLNDRADRTACAEVLRLFAEGGGALVDSSPMYGKAEAAIGALTGELGLHSKLFMATKVWTSGREAGIQQMESSFQKMGAKTMDLMQIHNLVDWRTHLQTLRDWKAQGRIRYLGITHYQSGAFAELESILRAEALDFVQLNYAIDDRAAEERLLPLAQERGVAVLANRPLGAGRLVGAVKNATLPAWAAELDCPTWGAFLLKFILSHPAITCAIPATRNAAHMHDNLLAGIGRLPDQQERERMATWIEHL
ncbi:MAG: aldo/keto reductase [Gammaproteobacteria bacterium]